MSEDQNSFKDFKLIEDVPDNVSTDIVTDLKTGIYNLFVNLYRAQIPYVGPRESMVLSIDFLEEIIYNFKNAIQQEES